MIDGFRDLLISQLYTVIVFQNNFEPEDIWLKKSYCSSIEPFQEYLLFFK